jgi:hypothetical protein
MKNYLNISAFSFLFFLSCSKENSVDGMQSNQNINLTQISVPDFNLSFKFKKTELKENQKEDDDLDTNEGEFSLKEKKCNFDCYCCCQLI